MEFRQMKECSGRTGLSSSCSFFHSHHSNCFISLPSLKISVFTDKTETRSYHISPEKPLVSVNIILKKKSIVALKYMLFLRYIWTIFVLFRTQKLADIDARAADRKTSYVTPHLPAIWNVCACDFMFRVCTVFLLPSILLWKILLSRLTATEASHWVSLLVALEVRDISMILQSTCP